MKHTTDMTVGSPMKLIFSFGLPLLAGNILQQLYNFVDTIVVGRGIGTEALAAVGATGSINFLVLGFIMGMGQGVSILVSQFFGAKDYRRLRQSITMSVYISIAVCLVITVASLLGIEWILAIMNTPAEIVPDALAYIRIIFLFMSVSYAYNFLSGILRAAGDSRNPVIALVISFFVNVTLDVLFVFGFHMGVEGAAYATVIAQGVSALYCFISYMRTEEIKVHREDWSMNHTLLKESFFLSLPVAIMNSITAVGCMVLQTGVNGFGTEHIAASSASSKVIMILEQIGTTFGYAMSTFTGQNIGAGKHERIISAIHRLCLVMLVFHVILAAVLIFTAPSLMAVMIGTDQPDVITYSCQYLTVNYIFLYVLTVLWIYRCSLQAMGDTVLPMVSGFAEFASRIIFTITLPALIGWYGIAFAEVSAWCAACIVLIPAFYYRIRKISSTN